MATIVNTVTDPQAKVERRLAALETAQIRTQQISTKREIGGLISSTGELLAGGGFTVAVIGVGEYRITYTVEFPSLPIVHVTMSVAEGRVPLAVSTKTQATVIILNAAGAGKATGFNFTAKLY